jgi:hypothetical protein
VRERRLLGSVRAGAGNRLRYSTIIRRPVRAIVLPDQTLDRALPAWPGQGDHIRRAVESSGARLASHPTAGIVAMVRAPTRRDASLRRAFLYDSDAYGDELPYDVLVGGRPHLVVPYGLSTNDCRERSIPPATLSVPARCVRHVVRRRRPDATHDVGWHAYAHSRPPGSGRGARALP